MSKACFRLKGVECLVSIWLLYTLSATSVVKCDERNSQSESPRVHVTLTCFIVLSFGKTILLLPFSFCLEGFSLAVI